MVNCTRSTAVLAHGTSYQDQAFIAVIAWQSNQKEAWGTCRSKANLFNVTNPSDNALVQEQRERAGSAAVVRLNPDRLCGLGRGDSPQLKLLCLSSCRPAKALLNAMPSLDAPLKSRGRITFTQESRSCICNT
eukprot:2580923-Pleurochrysis_carterae.AAC.8